MNNIIKIGLIQVDGKLPNLALMKISAWHKEQGHEVIFPYQYDNLFIGEVDKVYASVVFTDNRGQAEYYKKLGADVGGTGWDLTTRLPSEIEEMKPDFELYGIDYGIGFTSRGCIRKCSFCVVPEKEGLIHHVNMPVDLLNPLSNRLTLLDNNAMASPMWEQVAHQIIDMKIKVNFTQGNDIRLMTKRNAELLAAMRHEKRLHFAYDGLNITKEVVKGIEHLCTAGIHPDRLTFFVLTNYDTTFKQDMDRIKILTDLGVNSYVMIYDKLNAPMEIKHLQRWSNSIPPLRKCCSFEDYMSTRYLTLPWIHPWGVSTQ